MTEPERTLGWDVLAWCSTYIRQPDGPDAGSEWRFTREQVMFVLLWYAVNERGRFTHNRGVLRRAKGWGKSPFVAALALAELCGPTRCDGFNAAGAPVAVPVAMPWVQLAGVSEKQTVNTMSMVLAMIAESPIVDDYGVDPGLTRIFTRAGGRLEPITASAPTAEGARPTFIVEDETHLWIATNGGHKLDQVNRRNLGKSRDGAARLLETTNAHEPEQDSVAERSFTAWQARNQAVLYDALEAPEVPDLDGDDETLLAALKIAYGDSTWVDLERVKDEIRDPSTPHDVARRFYLNQIVAPPVGAHGVIPLDIWHSRRADAPDDPPTAFTLDMTWDREWTSIGALAGDYVDIVEHRRGAAWAVEACQKLQQTHDVDVLVLAKGPAASLIEPLREADVHVREVANEDYQRTCGAFHDAVAAGTLTHSGHPALDAAITGALATGGSAGWVWDRKKGAVISPLVAVTLAWLARSQAEPRVRSL